MPKMGIVSALILIAVIAVAIIVANMVQKKLPA